MKHEIFYVLTGNKNIIFQIQKPICNDFLALWQKNFFEKYSFHWNHRENTQEKFKTTSSK